jgi:hypothetical protein
MIPETELMRLRDVGFEYFPAAREKQNAQNPRGHESYYLALYSTVTVLVNRNLSAVEIAAIRLLQAIAMHATCDAEQLADETLYDSTISSIKNAVKTLSELTGRTISLDCNEPVANVGMVQIINNLDLSELLNTPSRIDDWFTVIDDMTRDFYAKFAKIPNEPQAWGALWTSPPEGYEITTGKISGDDCLIMQGVNLSKSAFSKRWKNYTKKAQ